MEVLEQNTWNYSDEIPIYEQIMFHASPTARVLYFWLLSRAEVGEIQEFDKEDFDEYCIRMGRRRAYSLRWFVICVKELEKTPLLEVIRRYRGYGYKVRVFCPDKAIDLNELLKN